LIIYYNMAYSKSLAEGIRQYKETEEGRDHMSEAVERYANRKAKKSEKKTRLLDVKNLMETMSLSIDQALDALKINEEKEREMIIKAVQRGC